MISVRDELGRATRSNVCRNGHDKTVTGEYRNGECKACRRDWNQANHAQRRSRRVTRNIGQYGLSVENYTDLLKAQQGLCAICGEPETKADKNGRVYNLSVDHNHETGEVRGLLCNNCNRAIGLLKDNANLLVKAAAYLRGWD